MFDLQLGLEYRTCVDLEWSKAVGLENVRVFLDPILYSYVLVCFEWLILVQSFRFSPDNFKTEPLQYQFLKPSDSESVLNLNVRYSSPHCILNETIKCHLA